MKIKKLWTKLNRNAFSLKWTCNCCGIEIFDGDYFCNECKNSLEEISSCHCDHCGRRTVNATLYCESCAGKNVNFDMARSVYNYNETFAKIIYNFKYSSKTYLADIFAEKLSNAYLNNFMISDYLTYIPMSQKRLNDRGYNQSKLIADKMGEILNLPVCEFVDKKFETKRQATLTAVDRLNNLKNSFKRKKIDLTGKTITILDDVLTTGVTMDIIATQLKKMGAMKVYGLTIASVGKKIEEL